MRRPALSVVMTVYNGRRFLAEALEGILNQTFPDFELILVDDASTDDTPTLLRSFTDPRIHVVTNEKNLGPYKAANAGMRIASGRFIARHDADDVSLPTRFERQIQELEAQSQLVLIGTSYHVIDQRGRHLESAILPFHNDAIQRRLEKGNVLLHGTFMMRHDALLQAGMYCEDFPVSQDYDLSLRLAEHGNVAILPEPLYLFRFHRSSITRNRRDLQLACRQFAWSKAVARRQGREEPPAPPDVLAAFPPEPEKLLADALGTAYLAYASGDLEFATRTLSRAHEVSVAAGLSLDWEDFFLHRAARLAEVQGVGSAVDFLHWACRTAATPTVHLTASELIGEFFARRAFLAYRSGESLTVVSNAARAMRSDASWLANRGLVSIALRGMARWIGSPVLGGPELTRGSAR